MNRREFFIGASAAAVVLPVLPVFDSVPRVLRSGFVPMTATEIRTAQKTFAEVYRAEFIEAFSKRPSFAFLLDEELDQVQITTEG